MVTAQGGRINRNIVECKYTSYYSYSSEPDSELIETLWNVNVKYIKSKKIRNTELIETLWNVNYNNSFLAFFICLELIETLWNVNTRAKTKGRKIKTELIETLWNVNKVEIKEIKKEEPRINRNIVECK